MFSGSTAFHVCSAAQPLNRNGRDNSLRPQPYRLNMCSAEPDIFAASHGELVCQEEQRRQGFTGVRVYIIIESENAIHKHVRIGCLFLPDGEGLGKRGCLQDGRRGAAEAGDLVGNVALERLGPHAIHAGRMASVGGGAAC